MLENGDFPIEAKEKLIQLITVISKEIAVHSDLFASSSDVLLKSSDSTIIMQLLPKGKSFRIELFVKPLGDVQPYCKPAMGIRTVVGEKDGTTIQATRDDKKENANLSIVKKFLSEITVTDEKDEIYVSETPWDTLDILENIQDYSQVRCPLLK